MWSHATRSWDDEVLEAVAGAPGYEQIARVRAMLGEVDTSGGGRKVGNISLYFAERYGFNPGSYFSLQFLV